MSDHHPSAQHKTLDILFFGDIVGRPGREAVTRYLAQLSPTDRPDVVIANVENATHGFGLNERHYQDLLNAGVHIMTGGNHIWDRKELLGFVDHADRLLRPANFPENNAGIGAKVFEFEGFKLGVINLIGQVFMGAYNSPWTALEKHITECLAQTPLVFIDFHGEATAEKVALGHYACRLGASAFTGTHTHVQTADERILDNRMGYLSDTGFCGPYDSVIGMAITPAIERLRTHYPGRLDVAEGTRAQVNASRFRMDVTTGICLQVTRVNQVLELTPSPSGTSPITTDVENDKDTTLWPGETQLSRS